LAWKISGQRAPSPSVRCAMRHNESCTPLSGERTTTDTGDDAAGVLAAVASPAWV